MSETIFDELRSEHDEFRIMMESLAEAYDGDTFEEFGEKLETHQQAEEEVLYDRVQRDPEVHEMVLEGTEEHRVASDILRKLQEQNAGTELWMARMRVLQEAVEHHLESEENEFFPSAETLITHDEAIDLTERFERAKERVHAHA